MNVRAKARGRPRADAKLVDAHEDSWVEAMPLLLLAALTHQHGDIPRAIPGRASYGIMLG